jgi:alginate O-acetyltransferase complex protein AlgI
MLLQQTTSIFGIIFNFISLHRLDISSFENIYFFLFLFLAVVVYYLFRMSKPLLLMACFVFYISFSLKMTVFLIFLGVTNYVLGILLYRTRYKMLLVFAIAINAGSLIYYKYANFFIDNLHSVSIFTNIGILTYLVIPLGISFFTFELIHYAVDTYRGKKPVFNLLDYFLFIMYFPTLIAGPIKRFENFVPQLKKLKFDQTLFSEGVLLIIKGLFKKIVIANTLSNFANYGFDHTSNALIIFIGLYAFSLQIYFDFSGYTDIGRGSSALFGIKIPENFLQPYFSESIQEFWRRWHITLMSWLRDYVYIPLGGSRKRKTMNIFIVFLLSGLWHGAAWHFIFWGIYNGLLMIIPIQKIKSLYFFIKHKRLNKSISVFITFNLVTFGWILFRAKDNNSILKMFSRLLDFNQYGKIDVIALEKLALIFIVLCLYLIIPRFLRTYPKLYLNIRPLIYGIILALIFIYATVQTNPFIYFQF